MLFNDAIFLLMRRARELAGDYRGATAEAIENGYVTFQTMTIRRLCDGRRDVISLRRLLVDANENDQMADIIKRLDDCDHVCEQVNNYIAHTANPNRARDVKEWNLQVGHLAEAQKAICEVAVIFDRDRLQRTNYVALLPVPHFDMRQEFKEVAEEHIEQLWEFWHEHKDRVNAWIPKSNG